MRFAKAVILTCVCFEILLVWVEGAPYFGDYDEDVHAETRRKHKKKMRPCGRSDEAKTFFPVKLSYVNVNYNCGGGISNIPHGTTYGDDVADNNKPLNNHHQNKPHRPILMNFLQNHNGGGLFGLFDGSLLSNLFGNSKPKPSTSTEEIPVHEELDDIIPEVMNKLPPGQQVVGYNPLLGQYTQGVSSIFNPKRVFRQVYDIFDVFI